MNDRKSASGERPARDYRLLIGAFCFDPKDIKTLASSETRNLETAIESVDSRTAAGVASATIVQFTTPLTRPDVARLRGQHGLKLNRYIPNLAYLERLTPETLAEVRGDFLVRACIPYSADYKLAPSIDEAAPDPGTPYDLRATLLDDADPVAVQAALASVGAGDIDIPETPTGSPPGINFTLADRTNLKTIAQIEDIGWIEPNPKIVATNADAACTIQSGTTTRSPIWDHGLRGENQVIGIIDDGPVDINHVFFADMAPNKPGPGHRKILAIFNETNSPVGRHATHAASIAAGDELGKPGQHVHRGGAWAAKLVCSNTKDMDRPKSRSFLAILERSKSAGAFIHSNSWKTTNTSNYGKIANDADTFSYENENHLIIAAGSNLSQSFNSDPGIAKNTLCVAAANAFPFETSRGSGIDGPTNDKRRKPEIMAVGRDIGAAIPGTAADTAIIPGCHTSYATPNATAAAALVRQYFTEGWYPSGKRRPADAFTPTGALLKAVLLNSTVDMTQEPGYPSDSEGWGLIRLERSLYFDGGPRRLLVVDMRQIVGLDSNDRKTHSFRVSTGNQSEQLKITLVWTEPPPGPYGFTHPSMNLLKLTVDAPEVDGLQGIQYLGNYFKGGVSNEDGDGFMDLVNNVQMVIVNNPPAGLWTVTVRADSFIHVEGFRRQGYALVISGGLSVSNP